MRKIAIQNFLKMNPSVPQYSDKNQNYLIAGVNPISYLDNGIQEEQIAPLSASLNWLNISPTLVDSYSETNKDSSQILYTGSVYDYGQSFTNTTESTLSFCKAYLKKNGTSFGVGASVYATIYTHTGNYGVNGTPVGPILAISDAVTIASITGSFSLINFTFSGANKITLAANTHYVMVINFGYGDVSNNIEVGLDSSTPTASGNASYSSDGTNWIPDATKAMCFYVYSGIASIFIDGNITNMISSTSSTYSTYAITTTGHVYGITPTSITDLGVPVATTEVGNRLAILGGNLFALSSSTSNIYRMPLPSGSWVSVGGHYVNVGTHIIEPFLDFLAFSDGNGSGNTTSIIRKIDGSSFAITQAFDIGTGWGIMQMRNYNNKYLAIAAGQTGGNSISVGYNQNYLFLWNGTSLTYNYPLKIPGEFLDMKVVDSILYVAVRVSNGKDCLYYLSGTTLRKVFTPQISTIFTSAFPVNSSLFDFKNYLGIHLTTNSDLENPLLIYGKDEMGEIEFIHSYGNSFDQISVGYDGNLFANVYVPNGNSTISYLPSSGTYQQILYKSQWIPVKNLQAIDIYYDSPPQSSHDSIDVIIYGQGEDIIAGNSTTYLDSITSINYLTKKRTRLDAKGFVGDQVKIVLSTENSTWQPIIRAIVPIIK